MNRNFPVAFLCLIIFSGCASSLKGFEPHKKFSPEQLQEDFRIAWITYQQKHPGKYWYNPKDTVDHYFLEAYSSLCDSMTEQAFLNTLSSAIEKIKCGHSSVRSSKKMSRYNEEHPYEITFPLAMKVWNRDSMVVLATAYRTDSDIVRGTTILSINGKTPREIVDGMCQFISTDGWNDNFKYQVISSRFPIQYKNTFGLADHYDISYLKPNGSTAVKTLLNYDPKADTIDRKRFDTLTYFTPRKKTRQKRWSQLRSLTIDTANSFAIMKLNTFSNGALNSFFRNSFKIMHQQHIGNLAIELRENGGGDISKSNLLTRFIINHPFRNADTVAGVGKNFPYPAYVQQHFAFNLFRIFFTHKKADGRNHIGTLERHIYQPISKNHFNGQVYIITGGFTFSASTLFIHPLQGQKNITVLGEETGGGAYGNNAVNIPDINLPNTGLRVRLPLYRMVLDSTAKHDGHGILPDVYVPPSSIFIRAGKDPKMAKVMELVKARKRL